MHKLLIKKSALKSLEKMPLPILEGIHARILGLQSKPRPKNCKKLTAQINLYRIRHSDYRIVYHVDDNRLEVEIIRIAKRSEAYEDL